MKDLFRALVLLALPLAGCATSVRLPTEDARGNRAPRDPASVNVYAGREIGRKYQVVGAVTAAGDGEDGARALTELRKEAALLGADCVVDLRLEIERGFWSAAVKATGLAAVSDPAGKATGGAK
jgi:hypothetical protein